MEKMGFLLLSRSDDANAAQIFNSKRGFFPTHKEQSDTDHKQLKNIVCLFGYLLWHFNK